MAAKKGGLGRGLDALFMDNSAEEISSTSAVKLKLMDIEPNREQPRRSFDEDSLAELTESIIKHGVIQPLLVRPLPDGGYQLVAGERRWRAARNAGLTEVPVVVREMTDSEVSILALVENLQREDLNPVDEAVGYQQLIDKYDMTQEEVSERVGKSRPTVANALRLMKLPQEELQMLAQGKITAGHARALLGIDDVKKLHETALLIVQRGLSVRDVEKIARKKDAKGVKEGQERKSSRDVFFDEVEINMSQALSRKIRVITKAGKDSGTLEIAFYNKNDLASIVKAFEED